MGSGVGLMREKLNVGVERWWLHFTCRLRCMEPNVVVRSDVTCVCFASSLCRVFGRNLIFEKIYVGAFWMAGGC
jgi:hypothetical protein